MKGLYIKDGVRKQFGNLFNVLSNRYMVDYIGRLYFDIDCDVRYNEKFFEMCNENCEKFYKDSNELRYSKYTYENFQLNHEKYSNIVKNLPYKRECNDDISEIIPGKLYFGKTIIQNDGRFKDVSNVTYSKLNDLGIKNILGLVNYNEEMANSEINKIYKIYIYDLPCENISIFFDSIIKIIDESESIYIYSKNGDLRSASIIIAYIAKKYNLKFINAYNFVYDINASMHINIGFLYQLIDYIGV